MSQPLLRTELAVAYGQRRTATTTSDKECYTEWSKDRHKAEHATTSSVHMDLLCICMETETIAAPIHTTRNIPCAAQFLFASYSVRSTALWFPETSTECYQGLGQKIGWGSETTRAFLVASPHYSCFQYRSCPLLPRQRTLVKHVQSFCTVPWCSPACIGLEPISHDSSTFSPGSSVPFVLGLSDWHWHSSSLFTPSSLRV